MAGSARSAGTGSTYGRGSGLHRIAVNRGMDSAVLVTAVHKKLRFKMTADKNKFFAQARLSTMTGFLVFSVRLRIVFCDLDKPDQSIVFNGYSDVNFRVVKISL